MRESDCTRFQSIKRFPNAWKMTIFASKIQFFFSESGSEKHFPGSGMRAIDSFPRIKLPLDGSFLEK